MGEMKAISSAFLASSLLFLASCGFGGDSDSRLSDKPVLSPSAQAETRSQIDFSRHVKPILEERCVRCHDGSDKKTFYSLVNREEAFKGNSIVPGKPSDSILYLAAAGEHPILKKSKEEVSVAPSDLLVLKRWIASGAVWPQGETGELKGR